MADSMLRHPIPLTLLLLASALMPATAQAARPTLGGWNLGEQRAVREARVMSNFSDQAFHGEQRLAARQLPDAMHALAARLGVLPVASPPSTVSMTTFDRLLVAQLGASDVAATVQAEARRAGLSPPPFFGTEVVARFLGLRTNHPFPHEDLERYPFEAMTRAEAAHSFAVALQLGAGAADQARQTFARFKLPAYSARQRQALRIAVSRIGMPYVWGGETDRAGSWFGGQAHGGYDCSGLVWRVFKLGGLPAGRSVRGRTAAQQAGEMPRSARLRLAQVQPADLIFFGPGRFWQKATERRIVHEGIALSSEWMIHASGQGVYVSPLFDASRVAQFSWARRVL